MGILKKLSYYHPKLVGERGLPVVLRTAHDVRLHEVDERGETQQEGSQTADSNRRSFRAPSFPLSGTKLFENPRQAGLTCFERKQGPGGVRSTLGANDHLDLKKADVAKELEAPCVLRHVFAEEGMKQR